MSEPKLDRFGRITIKEDYASIEFERHLNHSTDRVWKAITDQDQLSRWYLCKVKVNGGPKGRLDLWFAKTHVYGEIVKWEPPRVFEHEWNIEPRDELPDGERTILRWELIEESTGTMLRLSHLNLTKKTALGFTDGIEPATSDHILLDRLQAFLNSGSLTIGSKLINSIREEYRKLGQS